jgi:allophanate hydrolase
MSPALNPSLPPRTVAQWRDLVVAGGDPRPWLEACRAEALAHAELHIWIGLPGDTGWQAQLAVLAERLAEPLSRAELVQRYPLLGVPFVVKDNIDIEGEPTTAACPAFATTAKRTATAVQRLLDAGAVWLAKTNLDQFATGLVGTRSPYGAPASTWSAAHVSGGSSSGSAVAVARGDVPLALGTDTAGSGRVPGGFNHIVGLKPTPGRVSNAGVVPACRSIDCVSVFALTVDDAARALAVLEGADAADPYSRFESRPGSVAGAPAHRCAGRLAADMDPGYTAAFEAAVAQARELGAELVDIDFTPLHEVAALLYAGPWVAERYTVLGPLLQDKPEAIDPAVRAVVSGATAYSAADAFEAQYRLRELAQLAARSGTHATCCWCPPRPATRRWRSWRPNRWLPTPVWASIPISSTCSAGARWRCRPA